MIQISTTCLWLGNAADLRDVRGALAEGIQAIIDLAIEEPCPKLPRVFNYSRFSITDDGENNPVVICAAVCLATAYARSQYPVAICCNAGLSRSPTLAAVALAATTETPAKEWLQQISAMKPTDVNPSLWNQFTNNAVI